MPIDKGTTELFVKEQIPYDIVSRDVVQSLKSPIALAIWVYLQTKPSDWTPRRSDIMKHFGIGRKSYDKGMSELKNLGLVWVSEVRNDHGHILDRVMYCASTPKVSFHTIERKEHPRSPYPQVGETTLWLKRPHTDTETGKDTEIIKDSVKLPFAAFYDGYDYKKSRKDAEKAWNKLTSEEQAAVMARLDDDRFKVWRDKAKKDGFCPYPATWLNAGQWEDHLPEPQKPNAKKQTTYTDSL